MKLSKFTDRPLIRVFKYRRVSTDRQASKGESIEAQEECLQEFLKEYDNMVVVGDFIDGGFSRHTDKRDGYKEMMQRIQNNECDLILFTRLDRWFGNLRHFLNTQEILAKHNVEWFAVQQPYYDNASPYGRAFINNSMVYAELEIENDGERIREHNKAKVAAGEVLSGATPLGYKIENKHLVPDEQAPIVTAIFEHYRDSSSLNETLQWMSTRYGLVRSAVSLKHLLRNTKYIGEFRDNKSYCPAIIEKTLFDDVQRMLNMNVKRGRAHEYVFSSLIVCDECKHNMAGVQQRCYRRRSDGSKVVYKYNGYRCYQATTLKRCSNKFYVNESTLEKYLLEYVRPELEKYIAEYDVKNAPALNNTARISSLEHKLDKLKNLYLNDIIDMNEYRIDREKILSQINELKETTQSPPKDLTSLKHFLKMDFETLYTTFTASEKRQLWRSVIKEIHVDSNRRYHIIFL